jgi:TolA-binding protein
MLHPIAKIAAGALAGAVAWLAPGAARADDVDQAIQKVIHLDQRVHIMALEFNEAPRDQTGLAEKRLIDAEGLLGLGRPDEAMTLLLDVTTRWPKTLAARDATFLLGDTLFQLGDFLSARRTYDKAMWTSKFSGTRREQRALVHLIEIALRTGDFEHVDRHLALLAQVADSAREPAVNYVKAKVLFYRGNLDEANRIFASIPPGSAYFWRARYLIGTIRVKAGDLGGATRAYEAMVQTAAPDDDTREIQDLARLALGRICYQQGQVARAAAIYQAIPPHSKALADGLYELGWTQVRAKDFEKARDAFARLLRLAPEGPRAPELKVLLANLHLRQGHFATAQSAFASARDELEPTYQKLQAVIVRSQTDPVFLETLNNRSLDEIDLGAFVPASARKWVRSDPEVERLLMLASDVVGTQKAVADATHTLQHIQDVLARIDRNGQRLALFPDLSRARLGSTEVLSTLVEIRGQFAGRARRLEQPYLREAEARLLERNAAERASIEQQLGARQEAGAPLATDQDARVEEIARAPSDDGHAPRSTFVPPGSPEPVGPWLAAVLQLQDPHARARFGAAEVQPREKAGVVSGARERAVADRLQQVLQQEQQVHQQVLTRLDPTRRKEIDRELEVVYRTDAASSQLLALDARLDAEADVRLAALQDVVADRRQDVAAVEGKLAVVVSQSQSLGGSLARVMYTRVADRLYDLIVRADVGLIDVAWGVKDQGASALQTVLAKKNREVDALKAELRRQEDALDRRFKAETGWAKAAAIMAGPVSH